MKTVLVCDDDKAIVNSICIYLKAEGFNTLCAYNGKEAIEVMHENEVHCIVLDIMMPVMDGILATIKIREESSVPIIFLSAKSEDTDKIAGLGFGADDYVTKPFNPLELTARIKAQLRRYKQYNEATEENENIIEISGLSVDSSTHKCYLFGEEIILTPTEFNILYLLCENAGKVVSTEDIFEKVWGEKYLDCNNTVMVHIRRIREKLHEPSRNPRFLKTVWGVGYTIEKK